MICVFAPEGESVRKYTLIFRGRTGNYEGKIKIRLQFESTPYQFHSAKENNVSSELRQRFFIKINHR